MGNASGRVTTRLVVPDRVVMPDDVVVPRVVRPVPGGGVRRREYGGEEAGREAEDDEQADRVVQGHGGHGFLPTPVR